MAETRYYTIFFEKLSLAATQKAPLFNQIALSLSKYAFLEKEIFIEEMYKMAFSYPNNEEILVHLAVTFKPSENIVNWIYCSLCKELDISMHMYNEHLDTLFNSIRFAHIKFSPRQINFLLKKYPNYKQKLKQLEVITPIEIFHLPNFLDENKEKFQHYFRQLQCYDFIFTHHDFLCDWEFLDISFEEFVVKLCSNKPELFDKIYFRMGFDMHKAVFILFSNPHFVKYSGLNVLKFEKSVSEAINKDSNGENYELLMDITEFIIHHPATCPLLYQFAALSDEQKLAQHTFTREIISYSYVDQYFQLLFLIASSSPSINIDTIINTFLKPIVENEEVLKEHLSVAALSSNTFIIPSLYKRGIKCLIEYFEAFKY